MRRMPRTPSPLCVDVIRLKVRSRAICPACRAQVLTRPVPSTFATSAIPQASVPFTERLRRQIWGTDTPPGQADPYGGEGLLEQTAKRRGKEQAAPPPTETPSSTATGEAYQPATTWEELEEVGEAGEWWEEDWDPAQDYQRFMTRERLQSPRDLTAALHRAVIEVWTFHQAGRPLAELSSASLEDDATIDVQVNVSADGATVDLTFPDDAIRERILQSATQADIAPTMEEAVIEASDGEAEAEEQTQPSEEQVEETSISAADRLSHEELDRRITTWGTGWHSISLADPALKFALLKRTVQLSGHRIPDPQIGAMSHVSSLLTALVTPPPPKKIADRLSIDERLAALPNVSLFKRRITPVDQEKMVGRWKIIERELKARGLPVTGRD
ncbi:MAG: hypothetical protein M1838_005108 [Thelocarpon superellum]|nr:MAG: hypothetical protein M1838_005108 [Thelocarpon superellum]